MLQNLFYCITYLTIAIYLSGGIEACVITQRIFVDIFKLRRFLEKVDISQFVLHHPKEQCLVQMVKVKIFVNLGNLLISFSTFLIFFYIF